MLLWRDRDGFRLVEVEEMSRTYKKFDEDDSGEISVFELGEVLRHLGYSVSQYDISSYVSKVDANGNGQLDRREFIKLMRYFREALCGKAKDVFLSLEPDKTTGVLDTEGVFGALVALGQEPPDNEDVSPCDFDRFMVVVDACRHTYVSKQRRKAGFSDEEVAHLQVYFEEFDSDGNGYIEMNEVTNLLKAFDWEPKTPADQRALIGKIAKARIQAKKDGVEDLGPCEKDPTDLTSLTFWVFLRLVRFLRNEEQAQEEELLTKLLEELRFSSNEVEQFRQIFSQYTCEKPQGVQIKNDRDQIDGDSVKRMIFALGVKCTGSEHRILDGKLTDLDPLRRTDRPMLYFAQFLRVMAFLVHTNFAGINDILATTKLNKQQAERDRLSQAKDGEQ